MRVVEIIDKIKGTIVTNKQDTEFIDIYAGDLLSNVMGHAKENNMFLTIMCNMNTIAVASLLDLPVIVFAEGVMPTNEMIEKANDEDKVLISTTLSVVDVIRKIYGI